MPGTRPKALLRLLPVALLLVAGCGSSSKPDRVEPMEPTLPADLCATLPESTREGLVGSASSDGTGSPTAACSLRSEVGERPEVRAVVTWLQVADELSADDVFASQCRAIDPREFRVQDEVSVEGADTACAGTGTVDGTDSATMVAVTGLEVVTVRFSSTPPGSPKAQVQAREMLEGVLAELAGR